MGKKEDLEKIDELVRKNMIAALADGGDTNELSNLSVAVNYLKANAVVAEKAKSTVEEETKKRLKEAAERRKKRESQ